MTSNVLRAIAPRCEVPVSAREAAPVVWLTADQAADRLQSGKRLIYRAIAAGHMRAARIGGRRDIRIRVEWVDEYADRTAAQAPEMARG